MYKLLLAGIIRERMDNSMNDKSLKPCPMCGNILNNGEKFTDGGVAIYTTNKYIRGTYVEMVRVVCGKCGLRTKKFRKESKARKAWNKRYISV